MEVGDTIMVYYDPITQENPEGRAKLLDVISSDGFLKFCVVEEVPRISCGAKTPQRITSDPTRYPIESICKKCFRKYHEMKSNE